MANLRALYSTRNTPQDQPIPGKAQVKNSAGGFVFAIDDWSRLDRFLVMGTDAGTYYVGERNLTVANAECVQRCIAQDGLRVVNRIVEISEECRAPKNDPALFALAMCAAAEN
jgi:60 kDa SS-A/Ro ribonucleoprotein